MTILLQWLIEHAWIFYAACAVGVVIYVVRALVAQRERNLAMFTLERETATARVVQACALALIFTIVGAAVFVSATFILPDLDAGIPQETPTLVAGLESPTPSPTPGFLVPTFTPAATSAPVPTPPPPEPAETSTPAPPDTEVAVSDEVYVRFGDFAALVGYSLPAAEVTTAQPLLLILHWQALEGTSPMNYQVFTHLLLLEDDRLIAQHDSVPVGGTRPLTDWVPGETIVDSHPMVFHDTAHTGPARIAIGLWDPATGLRVLTDTGDERVVLPITINIIP